MVAAKEQTCDGPSMNKVLLDELVYVVERDARVPDVLGVDDHDRPVTALRKAARFVHANTDLPTALDRRGLERTMKFGCTLIGTRLPGDADEDMPLEGAATRLEFACRRSLVLHDVAPCRVSFPTSARAITIRWIRFVPS